MEILDFLFNYFLFVNCYLNDFIFNNYWDKIFTEFIRKEFDLLSVCDLVLFLN